MSDITVIGGSGFIGTYLITAFLKDGHNVLNIDKRTSAVNKINTVTADIRDGAFDLGHVKTKAVVLLAAEHRDDVSPVQLYYDVNVSGTKNVLDSIDKAGINKIIFTSSVAVYGLNKKSPDESHPSDPFNHYGKSKWQAEEVLRDWYNKSPNDRTLIIIRPTVVFGPGNKGNVYNLLKQIAHGKFLKIGKGENKKSMAYVENIADFIKYCVDKNLKGYHLFNYVDKPDLTTNELLSIAEKALQKKLPSVRIPYVLGFLGGVCFDGLSKITKKKYSVSSVRIKKFCATTQFSSEKIIEIGFRPKFSLEEGLSITIKSINTPK